MHIEDKHPEI